MKRIVAWVWLGLVATAMVEAIPLAMILGHHDSWWYLMIPVGCLAVMGAIVWATEAVQR